MRRSLIRKELTENRIVILLAVFLLASILTTDVLMYRWNFSGRGYRRFPGRLLDPDLIYVFWMIPAGLSILLGLTQTLADSVQGTWGYLLHLPPGRRWVVSTKLWVGGVAYLACCSLFLLGCVLIAWSRQTEVFPFRWGILKPFVQITLAGIPLYLGSFLSGLRPALWYGSRLLPLAGCWIMAGVFILYAEWWLSGLALLLVVCGLLVAVILHIGESRDFA